LQFRKGIGEGKRDSDDFLSLLVTLPFVAYLGEETPLITACLLLADIIGIIRLDELTESELAADGCLQRAIRA
jgi:hypothetical protein